MALEIFRLTKKLNKGNRTVNSLMVENLLFYKSPKILFNIVHPSNDNMTKYVPTKAFLDVPEVYELIYGINFIRNQNNPEEVMQSYKGGYNKERDMVEARIFSARRKGDLTIIQIDCREGEQVYVENKFGEKVPGVVKPKSGSQSFEKGSIALTKAEARYLANSLDNELKAWRVALNMDFMRNPQKYNNFQNNQGQGQGQRQNQSYGQGQNQGQGYSHSYGQGYSSSYSQGNGWNNGGQNQSQAPSQNLPPEPPGNVGDWVPPLPPEPPF